MHKVGEEKTIICPFCFKKFNQEAVHFRFRAENYSIEALNTNRQTLEAEISDDDELKRKLEELEDEKLFLQHKEGDERLDRFWNGVDYKTADRDYFYPYVTPKTASKMTRYGYEKNPNGMVHQITDKRSGNPSMSRLCPYCHNPLPAEYGYYDTYFFALVGITSSGKTVYLSQLMNRIEDYLSKVGVPVVSKEVGAISSDRPRVNQALPAGTSKDEMKRPLLINISRGNKGENTLVFYDIAGENTIDPVKLQIYGPYIKQADGILFIVDPAQFDSMQPILKRSVTEELAPAIVTQKISSIWGTSEKIKIPLAIILSKNDELKEKNIAGMKIGAQFNMFQKLNTQLGGGYTKTDFVQINGEVMSIFDVMDRPFLEGIKAKFEKVGCFAMSALGCGVKAIEKKKGGAEREIDKEAADRILQLLDSSRPNPELEEDEDGYFYEKITFIKSKPNTVKTFKEIRENPPLIEFRPEGNPDPIRIEEPLYWILGENGIIDITGSKGTTSLSDNQGKKKGFFSFLGL